MHARPTTAEAPAAACHVTAHALTAASLSEIQRLRDEPVPNGAPPLPHRFLRHCDEQTVVGVRAVLAALASAVESRPTYSDYGVVAGACRAGRIATARSLALFRSGGAVTVSPHIVPQCSLHSLAGAVSVALGMHGPHVGASGGPHAIAEGMLAAFSLAAAGSRGREPLPGIWLVLTGWTREPVLDPEGQPTASAADEPICRALAAALVPVAARGATAEPPVGPLLSLHSGRPVAGPPTSPPGQPPSVADDLLALDAALTRLSRTGLHDQAAAPAWSHRCPWSMELRLTASEAAGSARPLRKEAA